MRDSLVGAYADTVRREREKAREVLERIIALVSDSPGWPDHSNLRKAVELAEDCQRKLRRE